MNDKTPSRNAGQGLRRPFLPLTLAVRVDGALSLPGRGSLPASRLLWTSPEEGGWNEAGTVQVLLLPN